MIRYEGPEDQGNRGVFAVDERLYPWGIQDHTLIICTVLPKGRVFETNEFGK